MPSRRTVPAGVYLPLLAAELAEGWSVSEGTTFTSPSGIDVNVQVRRAAEGRGATESLEAHKAWAHSALGPLDDLRTSTVLLQSGRAGEELRFAFDRDGGQHIGRIVCSVRDGLALTVTALFAQSDVGDHEVDALLAGLRVGDGQMTATIRSPEPASPVVERRSPFDPSAWSAHRRSWSKATVVAVEPRCVARWSLDELAVFAMILRSPFFPTVDSRVLASLPEVALNATVDAVVRSLVARGLARPGDRGSVELADELRTVVGVAVLSDLAISVDRFGSGGGGWWFGAVPDRAVQVTVLPDGSRECGALDPADLLGQIMALGGLHDASGRLSGNGGNRGAPSSPITVDDVLSGTHAVQTLVQVNTAWRSGHTVHGGVFGWTIGLDGELSLAEPEHRDIDGSTVWHLRACDADDVLAALLEHLPGA